MIDDICPTPRVLCLDLRQTPYRTAEKPPAHTVLCLGNFDGVHAAHTELLRRGLSLARTLSLSRKENVGCGVLCFFRPSSDFFNPCAQHLTTLREKLRLFALSGIEYAYLCDFSAVRALPAEHFLTLLARTVGCVGTVCGFNHRFGAGARGDAALLTAYFGKYAVYIVPEIKVENTTVSSTNIRDALLRGDAESATRLLGRPYSLDATVTSGKKLGRTIGFPTANQYFPAESIVPAHGVYASLCHTPDGVFPAVTNVGNHPTVDAHARINCESFIMGYTGNLYGCRMKTELLTYLRPETRFTDISALRDAIAHDAERAMQYIEKNRLLPE